MSKVFIIAEAGVNHNGSIEIAKKLIDEGYKAGVDAIKFQSFKTENLVTVSTEKAEYQKGNTKDKDSQFNMLKNLELSRENHLELKKYSEKKGILFLSSPFDLESIDLLCELNMEVFKIPSSEIENVPYLRMIGGCAKKIILSTGMSTLDDIKFAIDVLKNSGAREITLLHCTTSYPCKMEDVNISAIKTLKNEFNLEVGYSDHTRGIEVAVAAVAMGATVIEKHFTLNKNMDGPDHKASLEPQELREMVREIRNIELALGSGIKEIRESEKEISLVARKSLVALKDIKKGDIFSSENICVKRPGIGITPKRWDEFIGSGAKRSYAKDQLIIDE